jgi:predicted dehydrogenase
MAEYQVKKFRAISDCTIKSCTDTTGNLVRVSDFSRRMNIPHIYASPEELWDSGNCDAFSCAAADSEHYRVCEWALRKGIPVFCEKPLARTVRECEVLVNLARKKGTANMVNFSKRNSPAMEALKKILRRGLVGRVFRVEAEYLQSWVATKVWGDWRTENRWKWRLLPEVGTAGVLGDLGSHVLDALLYLLGPISGADCVKALTLKDAMDEGRIAREPLAPEFSAADVPAYVEIEGRVRMGGISGDIRLSWLDRDSLDEFRIRIYGDRGTAVLDPRKNKNGALLYPDGNRNHEKACIIEGLPPLSTYECFITAADDASLPKSSLPDAADRPDFVQGLVVQRAMSMLLPQGRSTGEGDRTRASNGGYRQ